MQIDKTDNETAKLWAIRGFMVGGALGLVACFLSGAWPTLPDDYPKLPVFRTDIGPACLYQSGTGIAVISKTEIGLWPDDKCP